MPLDRSGVQLVCSDRSSPIPGEVGPYLAVTMICRRRSGPSIRQAKRSFLSRSCSLDRSIVLSGAGAAQGGEEGVGPMGDVVVVDLFA